MKSKIFFFFILGMLTLSAADLNAQVKGGAFSAGANIGYGHFAETSTYDNTPAYGISLGYDFSETFGIEATYNTIDTEIKSEGITETDTDGELVVVTPGGTNVSGSQIRIEGLYYVYQGNKFAPYVALGIGTLNQEYQGKKFSRMNAPAGFGFKYFVTDGIALRADVRSVLPVHFNDILVTVGATFRFGGN